jgi:hypothetical protein
MPKSIQELLAARAKTHGDFRVHATCSQDLKRVMQQQAKWDRLRSVQQEALDMIQHKVARILAGNPDTIDHWDDIVGYATLAANQLRELQGGPV